MPEETGEKASAPSVKEERIRSIALSYYSRQDIRKSMLEFAHGREVVPRYFEGFGKRPDALAYEMDILELAKKGATSFHCSEELWKDALSLSTELPQEKLNELRQGWDLLIDIDSKWLDYSRIAAELMVKALEHNGVRNIGIKFSGSKGFHIIVPWKAFPPKIQDKEATKMFPEWPRLICHYLSNMIKPELIEKLLILTNKQELLELMNKDPQVLYSKLCKKCNINTQKITNKFFKCSECNFSTKLFEEKYTCPKCNTEMKIEFTIANVIDKCPRCNETYNDNPNNFKIIDAIDPSILVMPDIVLMSSRHLFRMPYSLHEKTSLASVVIDKDKIAKFEIADANPMKIKPRNFLPDAQPGEATELLLQALDYQPVKTQSEIEKKEKMQKSGFKEFVIKDLTPWLYPPSIKTILEGMKSDGRKRALFILLNFFKSLKVEHEKIEKIIDEWNKKNYAPLPDNYIKSQLSWHAKTPAKLPPNFDKPHYKEIGIQPTPEELNAKNPVNYVARKSFALQSKSRNKNIK